MVPPTPREPTLLGTYVRQRREALGLSQRQLAKLADLDNSTLARLESGVVTARPKPEHLQRLADALGIDVSRLLKYLGVTPKPDLPAMRTYFRRKLGVNAAEADILAGLIEDHRRNQSHDRKEDTP